MSIKPAMPRGFCSICDESVLLIIGSNLCPHCGQRLQTRSNRARVIRSQTRAHVRTLLLPLGLLGILAAQFSFARADVHQLPMLGVFAMLAGIAVIALWAMSERRWLPTMGRTSVPRIASPGVWTRKITALVVGSVMQLALLTRVWTKADNTWDVGLWFASMLAFATFFFLQSQGSSGECGPSRLIDRTRGLLKRNWREGLPLLLILAIYCALTIPHLTSWKFSYIGDEQAFYTSALRVLEDGTEHPFSQDGVWRKNPEFDSIYKAVWMALFGDDHFGWKMTGVASMALAISGMYALGRILDGRVMAVAAAGLFGASHYLFGLLNGGYNHLDSFPIAVWAMVAFVLGLTKMNPALLFLAGLAVGVGFYFHYSARIVGPVMLLVALFSVSPKDYLRLWPVAAGGLLAAWPTFLVSRTDIITRMMAETPFGYASVIVGPVPERFMSNLRINLPAFHFSAASTHYVSGPLLDSVTGAMAAVGIGAGIGNLRSLAAQLCLIWLAVAFLSTGMVSPYPDTAVTRLFPMMPPLVLLAALAASVGWRALAGQLTAIPTSVMRMAGPVTLVVLLVTVLWLNQHRALVETHESFHYTNQALAIGASKSEHCSYGRETVFVGVHPESTLRTAIRSYHSELHRYRDVHFETFHQAFDAVRDLSTPACVILFELEPEEEQRFMTELKGLYPNGQSLTYRSPYGVGRILYFRIP